MAKSQQQLRRMVKATDLTVNTLLFPFKVLCFVMAPLAYLVVIAKGLFLLIIGKL